MKEITNYHIDPWPVASSYKVGADGWVYPSGDRETYNPFDHPLLPTELARVNRPWRGSRPDEREEAEAKRKRALLKFMREFGLLGQTVLLGKPRTITDPGRVVLDDQGHLRDRGIVIKEGDSLDWALEHARNVDLCLHLMAALKTEDIPALRRIVASLTWIGSSRRVPTLTDFTEVELDSSGMTSAPVDTARKILAAMVNPNLNNVERVFTGERSVFKFKAMIQVVYWMMMDSYFGENLNQCQECHTYFYGHLKDQKFCPAPKNRKESRCAKRSRYQGGSENG